MKSQQIDLLNIGLIILSAILAYHFPLQLFLVSFTILGPLHYLTEINWLDKKQYFTQTNNRTWLWIALVSTVIIISPKLYFYFSGGPESALTDAVLYINSWTTSLYFMCLILAVAFIALKKKEHRIILVALGCILAFFLNTDDMYSTIIGVFVPTIIHVYIFTLLFMLYGAKKSKSTLGYLAVAMAVFVPIMLTSVQIDNMSYVFSSTMKDTYLENHFYQAPLSFAKILGKTDGLSFFFYEIIELRLMMFMSFIYFYHYLNWFSKTTLIQWHKTLTTKNSITIVSLWAAILALFYYDFRLGFFIALFFSVLHVITEFPLNIMSIKGIISRSETSNTKK